MTDRLAEIKANHDRDIRTYDAMGIELPRQCKEIAWLIAEVERVRRGELTPEEVHEYCHNLDKKVGAKEFAWGCAEKQRELFGCAPDADAIEAANEAWNRLSTECSQLRDDAERWRFVKRCGGSDAVVDDFIRREKTAAVDAARKAT